MARLMLRALRLLPLQALVRGLLRPASVGLVAIDEADMLLSGGFLHDVRILGALNAVIVDVCERPTAVARPAVSAVVV